jgi:hypothetical protein
MKSDIMEDRYYIECPCMHPKHMLAFDIYEEQGEWECCIYTPSCDFNDYTFIEKVKHCFRFLFGSHKYHLNETFLINEGNMDQFEKVVRIMKRKLK